MMLSGSATLRKLAAISGREWGLLAAVFFAAVLRLYHLPDQLFIDDEWHAIHAALTLSYSKILTSFGANHISAPIALWYRLLIDSVGLNECLVRWPYCLFGVAIVALVPLLLRRFIGREASTVLAWLLAVSPLLVFFSRFARPYIIVALVGWIAVWAFYHWWREARFFYGALYVATATMSVWLLPVAAPFVYGPLLLSLVARVRPRSVWPQLSFSRWLGVSFWTLVAFGLTIGPALFRDLGSLTGKSDNQTVALHEILSAFDMLLGHSSSLMTFLVVLLILRGSLCLWKREKTLMYYLLALSALQVIGVILAQPAYGFFPLVVARYLLLLLPLLLTMLAVGVTGIFDNWHAVPSTVRRSVIPSLLCLGLFLDGPLPGVYGAPSAWFSQVLGLAFHRANGESPLPPPPLASYEFLGRLPRQSVAIMEVSNSFFTLWGSELPAYDHIANQRVLIGMLNKESSKIHYHVLVK